MAPPPSLPEEPRPSLPEEPRALAAEVVHRWGCHPARLWGIQLAPEAAGETARWLVAACLLDGRTPEERAAEAFQALIAAGWDHPAGLAAAEPHALIGLLSQAGIPKPEGRAGLLSRVARGLSENPDHGLERRLQEAASLEELGGALSRLAPGFGRAAITRFLQPLREIWGAAMELPLDPAARAAAVHLGLLQPGEDEEGEPAVLGRLLRDGEPKLSDVEAALARLGRRSCLREKISRCPLKEACPAATGSLGRP